MEYGNNRTIEELKRKVKGLRVYEVESNNRTIEELKQDAV